MDVGVGQMKGLHKKSSKRRNSKKDIKVVYISTPMKFKTCASQFRALVQELTGKDSDVAVRFMDSPDSSPANSEEQTRVDDDDDRRVGGMMPLLADSSQLESAFEPRFTDDGLMSEGSFLGMFTSNLFNDPAQFDAIRSLSSV